MIILTPAGTDPPFFYTKNKWLLAPKLKNCFSFLKYVLGGMGTTHMPHLISWSKIIWRSLKKTQFIVKMLKVWFKAKSFSLKFILKTFFDNSSPSISPGKECGRTSLYFSIPFPFLFKLDNLTHFPQKYCCKLPKQAKRS